MYKKILQIALAILLLCGNLVSAQSIVNDSISTQLKNGLKGFQERYHTPSIALVIVHRDQMIFSDALGFTDLDDNTLATIDSKYPIQSITKMFTATLSMNLWEKGIIRLDGDVRKFVPEFKGVNRNSKPSTTTFLELSTHSSGLPRNSPADIGFAKQIDIWMLTRKGTAISSAQIPAFLKSLNFVSKAYPAYEFMPQDSRHYSNMGYALLGLSLGRAAKVSYRKAVMTNVCRKLGLNTTGFGTFSKENNKIAKGYYYDNEIQQFIRTPDYYPNAIDPAGGMYSTARDLGKFISSQFSDKNGAISKKSVNMMQSLGIGWQRSYPYVKHEGAMLGGRTEIVLHPGREIGWVILTNTTDFDFNRINAYIAGLMLPLFPEQAPADLSQFIGNYTLEGSGESIKLYMKGDKLYSTYFSELLPQEPLSLSGNNTLKAMGAKGYDITYNFLRDSQGKVSVMNLNQLMWIKQ